MLITFIKHNFLRTKIHLKPIDKSDVLILLISIGLLVYTTLFALLSDISYDEAYTYTEYCRRFSPNFFAFDLANNHPLNSFLIYITSFLFPYREFAIRLPNILFLIFYLICSIRVSKLFSTIKLFSFGAMTLYFFLIPDFFSQGRGYGIAAALVLFFAIHFSKNNQNHKKIISNFYILLLASFAFTGLIPLVIAVTVYYVAFELKSHIFEFIKSNLVNVFILLMGFSWLLWNLVVVTQAGKPLYGSNSYFLTSTLAFYLSSYFDFFPNLNHNTLIIISAIFLLLYLFGIAYNRKAFKISFITILTFLIFYISSKFSGRPFITGRLLLPLFPLVVFSVLELINSFVILFKSKKLLIAVFNVALFCFLLVNYISKSNFSPQTSRGTYQREIFKNLNLDVEHNGCCSSIPFYLKKFKLYPPVDRIKNDESFIKVKLSDNLNGFYSIQKSVLLIESSTFIDINTKLFININPINQNDLPEKIKNEGFERLAFSLRGINSSKLIRLPQYNILSLTIGQLENKATIWEKTIRINKTQQLLN